MTAWRESYNLRGGKERIFDDMNNGFGWARLPKSFMAENTVFLLLTAIIRNFYKFLMGRLDTKAFGLKKCSRIKAFVFKFISVPAKWIRTARHYELNIYTHNHSYQNPFALDDGRESNFVGYRQHKAPAMLIGVRGNWSQTSQIINANGQIIAKWRG